mgnify:CR=1 FL=1
MLNFKKIRVLGFKSFVDPTELFIEPGLTGVVGPNGCGKSNVVESLKWVMGETSAKQMRGTEMEDVIFSGTQDRPSRNIAEVTLTLDNTERKAPAQFNDADELEVTRRIEREKGSNYRINGKEVRARDVQLLFADQATGARSTALVSQGRIGTVINAKPAQRRLLLEEAAGITGLHSRRHEAELRLKGAEANMERLDDILVTLDAQMNNLKKQARQATRYRNLSDHIRKAEATLFHILWSNAETARDTARAQLKEAEHAVTELTQRAAQATTRQAQAAEKYKEFKAEERQLKAQLQALRWLAMDAQTVEREHRVRELEIGMEALIAEQRNADSEVEKQRDQHADLTESFNQVQARYYSVGADISRIEQVLQFNRDRQRQLYDDMEQTEQAWQEAQSHLNQDQALLGDLQNELAEIEPELEMASAADEDTSGLLQSAEEAMQTWQSSWDQFNQQAAAPRQQAEVEQSRIRHLEQAIERLSERIQRLEDERSGLTAGPLDDELAELSEQLAEMELRSESEQQQLEDLSEALQQELETLNALHQERDIRRGEIQRSSGRLASLEALQQAALDHGQGVQQWLQEQGLQDLPHLAAQLQVDAGWERAVETVLGDDLQAVSLDDLDSLADQLGAFDQGSLRLLDKSSSPDSSGASDSLLGKVRSGVDLRAWLGAVRTAESLQQALALRHELAAHESVITREGHWLGPNWLRYQRGEGNEAGVLERQQEIETLEARTAEQEAALEEDNRRVDALRERIRQLEQQRDALQQGLASQSREQGDLKAKWSARQVRLEQVNARRQRITDDLEDIKAQRSDEQEQIGEARMTLQAALDHMAAVKSYCASATRCVKHSTTPVSMLASTRTRPTSWRCVCSRCGPSRIRPPRGWSDSVPRPSVWASGVNS